MNKEASQNREFDKYLKPTFFMDYNSAEVKEFAGSRCQKHDSIKEKAVKLYYAVRDEILYDPYDFRLDRDNFTASSVLAKRRVTVSARLFSLQPLPGIIISRQDWDLPM